MMKGMNTERNAKLVGVMENIRGMARAMAIRAGLRHLADEAESYALYYLVDDDERYHYTRLPMEEMRRAAIWTSRRRMLTWIRDTFRYATSSLNESAHREDSDGGTEKLSQLPGGHDTAGQTEARELLSSLERFALRRAPRQQKGHPRKVEVTEAQVYLLCAGHGFKRVEVADGLGVSRERIRQMHNEGERLVRSFLKEAAG